MPLFRARPAQVEAIHFEGTPVSALEIVEWARAVAPEVVVRERIEYSGWGDSTGHIELEIRGNDMQASIGDWVVCHGSPGSRWLEVVADTIFLQRFEAD